MLQRIQTVWIFLATLGAVFLSITGQDVLVLEYLPVILVGTIGLVLLGVYSMFSYRNRKKQLMLNSLSIFLNILLLGFISYWLLMLSGGIHFPEKGIEPLFPLISLFCLFMANIYIKRDEKLVKSVDRLR